MLICCAGTYNYISVCRRGSSPPPDKSKLLVAAWAGRQSSPPNVHITCGQHALFLDMTMVHLQISAFQNQVQHLRTQSHINNSYPVIYCKDGI